MLKAIEKTNQKNSIVEVVSYNLQWPEMFLQEAAKIRAALGENCVTVHHVGSTSISGISAKPIIDMVPVVKDILKVNVIALENLSYEGRGELGMLFRRYFSNHVCHLHIWEEGNPEIDKHLIFRDYLMSNLNELKRYEKLKLDLAKIFSHDRTSYTLSKGNLIQEMLHKAGFQGITMVRALTDKEWAAVKHMRQKYFFDFLVNKEDPYTWSFDDPKHYHIVLMKGCDIIGYAHLQFWPDSRAALRIIVIEEVHRKQGMGQYFLAKLERWLTHQGILSLHIQSSPEAQIFYRHAGYSEMPFNDPDGYEGDPRDVEMGKTLGAA
ncbi:MAG: GNAT family N-acetyltransferase [Candidatus Paracaedibacter sp.]